MWAARGCTAWAEEGVRRTLWPDGFTPRLTATVWSALDSSVSLPPNAPPGCEVRLVAAGLKANVNALAEAQLKRLLTTVGVADVTADSVAAAVMDWADEDDARRPAGAEAPWYSAAYRAKPRNGPFGAPEELRLVRGCEALGLDTLLGVRRERVWWRRAPRAVVASLPGMNDEAMALLDRRGRDFITDLPLLGTLPDMSEATRHEFARAVPALIAATTPAPEAWINRASSSVGTPRITVQIETRIAMGDRRLYLLQQRILP